MLGNVLHLSRWSLRSKMVVATVGLLTVICFVVGAVCYASMSISLYNQLDRSLIDASNRVTNTYRSGPPFDGSQTLGLGVGTLSTLVQNGRVGIINVVSDSRSSTQATPKEDVDALASIRPSDRIVNRTLSFGEYRLIAAPQANGDFVITGVPTHDADEILTALLATIIFVSASGILTVGLLATVIIRRAMSPLNQLAAVAMRVSRLPLDEGEVKLAERAPDSATNPHTEVGTVGMALNKMLDNVASALQSRQRSETKVRQFVADASHELRTPLTAIRGYTEMIRMTEQLSPTGEKSLSRVESQSKRMTSMVQDLLTLARLDEGRPLELKDTEMTQVVVETVNDMKVAVPDHHWQLDLPSDPFIIKADPGGVRQVLLNLLANAGKHTEPGTTVTTSLRATEEGMLQLSVADNGPGIPEKFRAQIFDRFARADAARSGHDGTTGLGLSIVQAIVQAHGGTVSVDSAPGRTVFRVDLPRH
nr:HAMP domain-containing sensor histidine kinase [Psychromicrobium sp. YIM S02556]